MDTKPARFATGKLGRQAGCRELRRPSQNTWSELLAGGDEYRLPQTVARDVRQRRLCEGRRSGARYRQQSRAAVGALRPGSAFALLGPHRAEASRLENEAAPQFRTPSELPISRLCSRLGAAVRECSRFFAECADPDKARSGFCAHASLASFEGALGCTGISKKLEVGREASLAVLSP